MFLFLSKLLPLFLYPLGLAAILLLLALLLGRRPERVRWLLVMAFALLFLGGNRLVMIAAVRSLEAQHPPLGDGLVAQVGVVLGGATRGNDPPRPMDEVTEAGDRLLYAAHLYHTGVVRQLLLSGGTVETQRTSGRAEAEAMSALLVELGVPPEALLLEDQSRNTYENSVASQLLLDDLRIDEIILITSALHMPRSVALFEARGFTVIPAPTDFLVSELDWAYYTRPELSIQLLNLAPDASFLHYTSNALKEYVGMLIYRLQGWM